MQSHSPSLLGPVWPAVFELVVIYDRDVPSNSFDIASNTDYRGGLETGFNTRLGPFTLSSFTAYKSKREGIRKKVMNYGG